MSLQWTLVSTALAAAPLGQSHLGQSQQPASPASAASNSTASSLSDYRAHLQSLDQLVAACRRETIPANCRSDQVGSDAQITLPSGNRQIRFGWLRTLLDEAAKPAQKKQEKPTQPSTPATDKKQSNSEKLAIPPPTLAQRLADARKRLAEDAQLASVNSSLNPSSNASPNPSTDQRHALTAILAAKEYNSAVVGRSLKDQLLEKIGNWIDTVLAKLAEAGARSKWIGPTAEVAFGLLLSVALVWFLIRLERQGRLANPNPAMLSPGAGAASARDWQLWLEDARQAASRRAWRDAIHLLYWASISRLESSGMWPADRARTPREYLALLSAESDQRPNLAALTRSFERTWYANRSAAEADFLQAKQLAEKLGAGGTHRKGAR